MVDIVTAKTIETVTGKVTAAAATISVTNGLFDWLADNWATVGSFIVAVIALLINAYWKRRIALSIIKRNETSQVPVKSLTDLDDFDRV